jgi:hypothetical protein
VQALHRTIEKHDATIEMLLTPTPQARAAWARALNLNLPGLEPEAARV